MIIIIAVIILGASEESSDDAGKVDKVMKSDSDNKSDMENSDEEADSTENKREAACRVVVEDIRREEFGVAVELSEDGQRLMKKQQERLGRSLDRLSRDLYSKDTHFVLELIQNADDNTYPENTYSDIQKNE